MIRYNTVRFYPKKSTGEFFNIGVVVYDGERNIEPRLLSEEHYKKLARYEMINKKVLKNSLDNFKRLFERDFSSSEILQIINNGYKNTLDTGFSLGYLGEGDLQEVADNIYNKFVGYKFLIKEHAEREDYKEEFFEKSIDIVQKDFRNYIRIRKAKKKFDLHIHATGKKNIYAHGKLGFITKDGDVYNSLRLSPKSSQTTERIHFLNIDHEATPEDYSDNFNILNRNFITAYDYSTEESIEYYYESLARAANS